MLTRTELLNRWQEADAIARHVEDRLAAELTTYTLGKGPVPNKTLVESIAPLRQLVGERLQAVMVAFALEA